MNRAAVVAGAAAYCLLTTPIAARAQHTAERVTPGNAAARLFGGSDFDGGIDDWYLSNGVVEAIIDDAGPQAALVPLLGVDAPVRQSEAGATGGTLIDLGRVGLHDDQLGQLFSVAGLSSANFIVYHTVSASTDAGGATITAEGNVRGFDGGPSPVGPESLLATTAYRAIGSDPFLTIVTTIRNTHPTNTAGLGGMLDPIIWTQRGIVPFSPLVDRGFTHGVFDIENPLAAVEVVPFAAGPGTLGPDDGVMDPSTGLPTGEVAYGLLPVEASIDQDGDGGAPPVVTPINTVFGVSNTTTTAFGNVPVTGGIQPGGVLQYVRRLYVGDRNDVASVANPMLRELGARLGFATGTLSGDVDAADATAVQASLIATRTAGPTAGTFVPGTPVTQVRTAADGTFAGVVLPVGTYDLTIRAVERDTITVSGVVVTADTDTAVTIPPLSTQAALRLRVFERDATGRHALPAKVVFVGLGATPSPQFGKTLDASMLPPGDGAPIDLHAESFAGGLAQGNVVYLAGGDTTVGLRPGTYDVWASRGIEYGVARRRVVVRAGKTRRASFVLRRQIDTREQLSGDFHIHSARSFDASAPLEARVVAFAAEGIEVMVSTDHDFHVDYAPIIAQLGLGARIASIVGNEVTAAVDNPPAFPAGTGHINAWPLPVVPDARKDGAIDDEYVAPNWLFSQLRTQGAAVIQYNHPRTGGLGIFTNIGFDPAKPLSEAPNDVLLDTDVRGPGVTGVANPDGTRNLDFDVLEVGNGTDVPAYLAVRRDWFALLNQTDFATVPFIPGTAVSDSHRNTVEAPGYFRTLVGGGDDPATLDVSAFDAQIVAGNMIGTSGPFVRFAIEAADGTRATLGTTLATPPGDVTLDIAVDAPSWIPVEEVRVIVNGAVSMVFDASSDPPVRAAPANPLSRSRRKVHRFAARIPVPVSADTWILVEAGARIDPVPTPPEPANTLVPGLVPLAFTNPVFVDVGGNGFTPPGVSAATAAAAGQQVPSALALREEAQRKRQEPCMDHCRVTDLVIPAWVPGALAR